MPLEFHHLVKKLSFLAPKKQLGAGHNAKPRGFKAVVTKPVGDIMGLHLDRSSETRCCVCKRLWVCINTCVHTCMAAYM